MDNQNTPKVPAIEELSKAMERMYHDHDAQMAQLGTMITTLARLAGYNVNDFAKEVQNLQANQAYANEFNQSVTPVNKSSNE